MTPNFNNLHSEQRYYAGLTGWSLDAAPILHRSGSLLGALIVPLRFLYTVCVCVCVCVLEWAVC